MPSILITGGTGTFGRAFVRRLLELGTYDRIAILSRSESRQAEVADEFEHDGRLRFFIGDVRDDKRLLRAFDGIDYVVHAAALKRVEVGHYNPDEMVKTNVLGTMNVVDAAKATKVRRVVGISSDKAWQPISAYGQSKALAETILLNANNTVHADVGPVFNVVRYGNVAGSTGSVIPKWRKIIENGGHVVPVSSPECTRFWMRLEHAVDLVLGSVEQPLTRTEVPTIPQLPAYRLGDLAEAMGVEIKVTGLPAWEKLHEGMDFGNTSDVARRMSVREIHTELALVA